MAINKKSIVDIELEGAAIHRSFLNRPIGLGDNQADSFGVRVFRNGEPVDLTGASVQGFFRNPRGTNIALTEHGTIEENVAYVTLPQDCYNYEGQFTLAIKVVSPGTANTVTMRIVDGIVDNTNTSEAVAPAGTIPSYQEILAVYEEMVETLGDYQEVVQEQNEAIEAHGEAISGLTETVGDHTTAINTNTKDINDLQNVLRTVGETDLLWVGSSRTDGTSQDITFTWNADKTECTVNGTNSSGTQAVRGFKGSSTSLFDGIEAGKTYHIKVKTTDVNAFLGLHFYKNGTYVRTERFTEDETVTIPLDVTGVIACIGVYGGATVTNAKVYDIALTAKEYVDSTEILDLEHEYAWEKFSEKPLHFHQRGIDVNGAYYDATNRCATEPLDLETGVYIANSVNPDITIGIYNVELRAGESHGIIFNFTAGSSDIRIWAKKTDNSHLSHTEAEESIYIVKCDFAEPESEEINGVSQMPLAGEPVLYGDLFPEGNSIRQTRVWKMPKSGINLQRIITPSDTEGYMSACFFRLTDGILTGATDYQYGDIIWEDGLPTFLFTKSSLYYPYDDNLYFAVVYDGNQVEMDNLFLSFGSVKNGNGRLTNLSPASVSYGAMPTPNQDITGAYPSFTLWKGVGYATQQHFYGSVIRLGDAKAICCSADLSLLCWWYGSDQRLLGATHGTALSSATYTGVNYIDLSKYGEDGYAVVLVRSPFTVKTPEEEQEITRLDEQTMGGIHLRDYVLNNVFVQYYNKTVITHSTGMNPVLAKNIEQFKKINCGKTFGFRYAGSVTPNRMVMYEMKNTAPCFYMGGAYINELFQNVSLKSYATALQNPNSKVYWSDLSASGPVMDGFGMVCNNLPAVLYGIPWMMRVMSWYQTTVEYPHVSIFHDFDFKTQFGDVRPGDWMVGEWDLGTTAQGEPKQDGHVLLITDIIYINGTIFAFEGMESYPPMVRYRPLFLDPDLDHFNLEFAQTETLDTFYNILVRPDADQIKPLDEAFGSLSTDYTVGRLMCDRGTDSVYCEFNENCYITIADKTITSIKIYKDGSLVFTYTLPPYEDWIEFYHSPVFTGPFMKGVNIINIIRQYGPGYYTLKDNKSNDVQESFYVAPQQTVRTTVENETVNISMTNPDQISYVLGNYFSQNQQHIDFRVVVTFLPENIVDGVLSIPQYVTYSDEPYIYNYCNIVYKTDYGTYQVRRDDQDPGKADTYINSDGGWNDPIHDEEEEEE